MSLSALVGIAVGGLAVVLLLSFLLWVVSLQVCGVGPTCSKTAFSRAVRLTKKFKSWDFTHLDGTKVFLGSVPRTHDNLQELYAAGVRAVVSLNQRWEPQVSGDIGEACRDCGLAHLNLPTPDFSAPTQRDICAAVDFISEHVARGDSVYVHCNGGKGRSAVCVIAYLIRTHDLGPVEAYNFVASQRNISHMTKGILGIPRPQWRAVLLFEEAEKMSKSLSMNGGEIGQLAHDARAAKVKPQVGAFGGEVGDQSTRDRQGSPPEAKYVTPLDVPGAKPEPEWVAVD